MHFKNVDVLASFASFACADDAELEAGLGSSGALGGGCWDASVGVRRSAVGSWGC